MKHEALPLIVGGARRGRRATTPRVGTSRMDQLLAEGDREFRWVMPVDEWESLALNYTSGTTGRPKGVVYHHRGAYPDHHGHADLVGG